MKTMEPIKTKRDYRIRTRNGTLRNIVQIQSSYLNGKCWMTIWEQYYAHEDHDYALRCAEEIIENLTATI